MKKKKRHRENFMRAIESLLVVSMVLALAVTADVSYNSGKRI